MHRKTIHLSTKIAQELRAEQQFCEIGPRARRQWAQAKNSCIKDTPSANRTSTAMTTVAASLLLGTLSSHQ
jgi:hypothetical protein